MRKASPRGIPWRQNMKKSTKILILCGAAAALGACSGSNDNGVNSDGVPATTINIKVYKGGHGTTWLYTLKEKFEAAFAKQNYRVNIITPSNTLEGASALADMRLGYKKSNVDLYLVSACRADQTQDKQYDACVESLDDVYSSHPISFDGTEESKLIKDKLDPTYDHAVKYDGTYYGVLWSSSPCGMVANTKVLSSYNLSLPRTTDELFNCFDTIYAKTSETGVYPFSWGGYNSSGYSLFAVYPWLAQILGKEGYTQFMTLQKDPSGSATQEDIDTGYTWYQNDKIYTPLTLIDKLYNVDTSSANSENETHAKAHYNVVAGKAAFTCDGEFFFNEVKANYQKYLNDITFMNTPVSSALGTILGISDKQLSTLIGLYDEDKTVEQAMSATSLSQEIVERVYEARGAHFEKAYANAYLTKGSTKADVAKLFLRMLCSNDFGKVFNETAYGASVYADTNSIESDYPFVNAVSKVINGQKAWMVNNARNTGLRYNANIQTYVQYNDTIVKNIVAKGSSEVINDIKSNMTQEYWAKTLKAAGYDVSK